MREQHRVPVANPILKKDGSLRGFRREVRRNIVNPERISVLEV